MTPRHRGPHTSAGRSSRVPGLCAAALLLLVLAGVGPAASAPATGPGAVPSDYEAINRPRPELLIVNPFFTLQGQRLRGVRYSVDGSWHEVQCSDEDRSSDGKTCGDAFPLDPGAHVLAAVLCTHPACSAFGKAWNTELRFNVGVRERVTIDLARLVNAKKDDEAITRAQRAAGARSACAQAAEQAFYANTCRAPGIRALRERLAALETACRSSGGGESDPLLRLALWEVVNLDARRCYKSEELRRLPRFLIGWGVEDGFWPPGTIKDGASSWRWARSMSDGRSLSESVGPQLLLRASALMSEWEQRQLVLDQLIDAVLDPARKLTPLLDDALKGAWDLNPTRPVGHRNFLLSKLAGSDPRFGADPRLRALLARGGAGDSKVHCAYKPEVTSLMRSYLADRTLSPEEWTAVAGFLSRTPTDASLDACLDAFRQSAASPVSQEERLSALAEADCAPSREAKVRGTTLSFVLDPDHNAAPRPLRVQLMRKYADCVAF